MISWELLLTPVLALFEPTTPEPPPPYCATSPGVATTIDLTVRHASFEDAPWWGAHTLAPVYERGHAVGLKLIDLPPESLPARYGFENGDILISIDGEKVGDVDSAQRTWHRTTRRWREGAPNRLEMLVRRRGCYVDLKLNVLVLPACPYRGSATLSRTMRRMPTSSVHGVACRTRIVPAFEDQRPIGLQVSGFRRDSAYDRAGLEHGDIIVCFDDLPVPNVDHGVASHLRKKWRDDAPNHFDVLLRRDDRFVELKLTILPE